MEIGIKRRKPSTEGSVEQPEINQKGHFEPGLPDCPSLPPPHPRSLISRMAAPYCYPALGSWASSGPSRAPGWLKPSLHVASPHGDILSFSKHRDPHLLYLSKRHFEFHFFGYEFHRPGLAASAQRVGNAPSLSSSACKHALLRILE